MSAENFDNFYNEVVAALRKSLTAVSGVPWTASPPIDESKLKESGPPKEVGWLPYNSESPDYQPPYAGFQLVDVARLANFALIAFRWYDTGDEIFVHTVDLHSFTTIEAPVELADIIISTNLLEWLGWKWYEQRTLRRIKGLTFIE